MASAVLFQGFHGTAVQIIDVVLGFLVICSGVILLQLAKSSKDVPDTAVFSGDLDQIRTVAEQEEPEYEPRADTLRSGASIVRAMSKVRTKRQAAEAKRIYEERMQPAGENEEFEWDGLRRRRTMSTPHGSVSIKRSKTVHPPLGMAQFPSAEDEEEMPSHPGFFERIGRMSHLGSHQRKREGHSPVPLETVQGAPNKIDFASSGSNRPAVDGSQDTAYRGAHIKFVNDLSDSNSRRDLSSKGSSLAAPEPPPKSPAMTPLSPNTRRQFSFQNVFHRKGSNAADEPRPGSKGALSFMSGHSGGRDHSYPGTAGKGATEEERAGLVHGDSARTLTTLPTYSEMEMVEEPEEEDAAGAGGSTGGAPALDVAASTGDLARQRRRGQQDASYANYDDDDDYDDDELYDEPLSTPKEYYRPGGRWI